MRNSIFFLVWIFTASACLGRINKPDLRTQECLKASSYVRNPSKFVCKDLGLCYKHYCRQITRRCNSCTVGSTKPSCLNPTNTTNPPSPKHDIFPGKNAIFPDVNATLPRLFTIQVSGLECTGFLASIRLKKKNKKDPKLFVTSANCLIDFKTSCEIRKGHDRSDIIWDRQECFGNQHSHILSVTKRFRAYGAKISSTNSSITIPLNSRNILIPRQFIECGDCKHDIAIIKLSNRDIEQLNAGIDDSYLLTAVNKERMHGAKASITLDNQISTYAKYGYISAVRKNKICINASNWVQSESKLLTGSPVVLVQENGVSNASVGNTSSNGTYNLSTYNRQAIGLATLVFTARKPTNKHNKNKKRSETSRRIITENMKPLGQYATISAVRFSKEFLKFVENWLDIRNNHSCYEDSEVLSANYDCFPSIPSANINTSLCLCSRGWTEEKEFCKIPQGGSTEHCTWNNNSLSMYCDRTNFFPTKQEKNTQNPFDLTIPGVTETLDLTGNLLNSDGTLHEILRHLRSLQNLMLDCNNINTKLPKLFRNARDLTYLSIRQNNITDLSSNIFRRNKKLLKLTLSSNRIRSLSRKTFRKQIELEDLDIKDNHITKLAPKAFRKNVMLRRINLSRNKLAGLPNNLFKTNVRLYEILLDHNLLETLPSDVFRHCPELHRVSLSNNKLVSISRDLFRLNTQLLFANFDDNEIAVLPNDLFELQNHLKMASFRENSKLQKNPKMFNLGKIVY